MREKVRLTFAEANQSFFTRKFTTVVPINILFRSTQDSEETCSTSNLLTSFEANPLFGGVVRLMEKLDQVEFEKS